MYQEQEAQQSAGPAAPILVIGWGKHVGQCLSKWDPRLVQGPRELVLSCLSLLSFPSSSD